MTDNTPATPVEPWWQRYAFRRWLYSVIAAALPLVGIYLGVDAVQSENWLNLAVAVLNISGGGAAAVALDNIKR